MFYFLHYVYISSLSLSQLVENTPRDIRFTLLYSFAVLSKIVMFIIMPISAILINKLGVNFNLILILTMFFHQIHHYSNRQQRMRRNMLSRE